MDVRTKGDWEGWIKFFLKGIAEVSDEATSTAKEMDETLEYDAAYTNVVNGILGAIGE